MDVWSPPPEYKSLFDTLLGFQIGCTNRMEKNEVSLKERPMQY